MPTWRRIGLSSWSDRVNAVPRSISVCDSAKRLIVMFKTSTGGEGAEKLSNAAELAIEKMELEKLESIRAELLDEYRQAHDWPWIIGLLRRQGQYAGRASGLRDGSCRCHPRSVVAPFTSSPMIRWSRAH